MVEKFCLESANYNVMHVFIKENTEWDKIKINSGTCEWVSIVGNGLFSQVYLIIEFKVKVHYTTLY